MKCIKFIISVMVVAAITIPAGRAQQEPFKNSLSIEPLYMLNDGLRLNYERQLNNPNNCLEISAIGYFPSGPHSMKNVWFYGSSLSDGTTYYDILDAWGAGLDLTYNYYLKSFLYVSGGIFYRHHAAKYESDYIYEVVDEGGFSYLTSNGQSVTRWFSHDRTGYFLRMGFQSKSTHKFLVGGYFGLGYSYSFGSNKLVPDGGIGPFSINQRGAYFLLGFKVGLRY